MENKRKIDRYKNSGYIFVSDDSADAVNSKGHPGYKYEHRKIAESVIGRKLADNEVVHHIDLNRSNNAPDNLMVLTNDEHARLHALMRNGIPFNDAVKKIKVPIVKCVKCGKELKKPSLHRKFNMCLACYNSYRGEHIPKKEDLENMLKSMTRVAIGKKFGVSCSAVRKWIRKYGILIMHP